MAHTTSHTSTHAHHILASETFFRQTVNKSHFSETPHILKQTLQILLPLKAAETKRVANTSAIPQTHRSKLKKRESEREDGRVKWSTGEEK